MMVNPEEENFKTSLKEEIVIRNGDKRETLCRKKTVPKEITKNLTRE